MKRTFVLVPTGGDVGLTSVALGLLTAMTNKGYSVAFIKPIAQQEKEHDTEHSTALVRKIFNLDPPTPIRTSEVVKRLTIGDEQGLQELFIEQFNAASAKADIVVIEGMVSSSALFFSKRLNKMMVRAFDADVILVAAPHEKTPEELLEAVEIEANSYSTEMGSHVAGVILNKVGRSSSDEMEGNILKHTKTRFFGNTHAQASRQDLVERYRQLFAQSPKTPLIALVPWKEGLAAPSTKDISEYLNAHVLRRGEWSQRRVESVAICSMGLSKSLYFFQDRVLVVATADRSDIVLAAAMASLNGVKLAGILLCGRYEPDPNLLILCERAFAQGLPVVTIGADMYSTVGQISNYHKSISVDEWECAKTVFDTVAETVDSQWLGDLLSAYREHRISGPEFRTRIINSARRFTNRKIVLPEGTEPRTVKAAVIVLQRQIAEPILLGNPEEVQKVAADQGLVLPPELKILNPSDVREKYAQPLFELRKAKGMTLEQAHELLQDNVWLGTMMLKLGDVDGLVSGAVHTTADTVKPALQIIKMAPGFHLASSIFFMCLPNQVLVYGDCAINQNPNAEELADIAIQSTDSAKAFGLPPRVAMISYSSGTSGHGEDVEKVRKATELVKARRPDILIDGPMQYDAATTESVGRQKMPGSPVAGRATVLVFPDLNTGNTTYKAVQRSTNTISVGPMLQGLARPVNDLSRGALVDDIIYTIAITAIQAGTADTTP
ncbi:MAG TPA: phosphate acetyltransferase [Fibrobacteraceae bacterium]|nr:phosphate acetyltransferase [Fibrobacteraceae bacterium]